MKKDEMLAHWASLEPNQKIHIRAVPYKHEGTTYDCDGIRIVGSKAFIDSVLSRLKDLLSYESGNTRLQVVYQESVDRGTKAPLLSWNCYIQVHERGGEAKILNAFISRSRDKGGE